MKLYVQQKVLSWNDRFMIRNEREKEVYSAACQFFSWGHKLHVSDVLQQEVMYIEQKVFSLLPRYFVYIGGEKAAEIEKEFTFLHPKYRIQGPDWEVSGDFLDHEYQITENGCRIAGISKKWFTWGDSYELDVEQEKNELLALAVLLAIDCVTSDAAAGAAASASAGV